jgi:3D (Asp-Asp-Asp) domain-containing protein
MGLRQKYKQFRTFMAVITAIIAFDLVTHPLTLAAFAAEPSACLLPEVELVDSPRSCGLPGDGFPISQEKPVGKPKTVVKSSWRPVEAKVSTSSKISHQGYHSMTAYTSEVAQTDASPCITANGFNVCQHGVEDTVAANFLPFGTKVQIPELFGDRVFIVRDRMNRRYSERVDVWMKDKSDALQFGVRTAKIVVLK